MPMKHPIEKRIVWALRGYRPQPVLDLLEETQWWPRERLDQFRNEKVRSLIAHCWEHVPYYREVMEKRGLTPQDVVGVADLPKLPVLTKDLLRQNAKALRAENIADKKVTPSRTGGTTGEPVTVWRREDDAAWPIQCYMRGLAWGGLLPAMPRVKLFGGSLGLGPKGLRDRLKKVMRPRTVFLPAFELNRSNVDCYVRTIRKSGAGHLIAYASALYVMAVLVEEKGLQCDLEAVYPTAEMLPAGWREKIAEVFGCKVLPYYGCGEVNSLGFSCGQGTGYHRPDEHAVMEVQRADGSFAFEGEGAFAVSDLDNYVMPILRYTNGDAGVLTDEPCACGRSLGRIARLDGRVNDFLVSVDGDRISGAIAAHTFRLVQGVEFYQYVQDEPGQVLVRIVPADGFDREAEEQKIRHVLKDHLVAEANVQFEYVAEIERTPAGKARFVINNHLERQRG